MKFVHAADIHLDSPLRGLDRYEGAPVAEFRSATRRALERLVQLCLDEAVDFLVIAGDLYDGNWKDYRTGLFFHAQMVRLRQASTPVYLLRGNHDAESQITRSLKLPENVRELSARAPETIVDEKLGLAVHGQSFATRAVTDDLSQRYPRARPGLFNLGVLHTCAQGREGHEAYAPCSLATLEEKGYEYWALGHVHKREVLCERPWIVFPGNLQGRHARETGAKGASLVTVESGRVTAVEHRAVDVVRWARCEVELAAAMNGDDAVALARAALDRATAEAEGRPLAARVVLTGRTRAHAQLAADPDKWTNELRAAATDVGAWVEKVVLASRSAIDLAALEGREDAIGQLVRELRLLRSNAAAQKEVLQALGDVRARLPPELRDSDDGWKLDDPSTIAALLDDVEQLVVPRLLEKVAP